MLDKTRDEIGLADQAKALMDNEAYKRAWAVVMDGLQEQRAKLPITDKDGAQALLICERMAYKFKGALESFVMTGRLVAEQFKIEAQQKTIRERLTPPWLRQSA